MHIPPFRFFAEAQEGGKGGIQGLGRGPNLGEGRSRWGAPGAGRPGRAAAGARGRAPGVRVGGRVSAPPRRAARRLRVAGLGSLRSRYQREAVGGSLSWTDAKKACGSLSHRTRGLGFSRRRGRGGKEEPKHFSVSLRHLAFFFLFFLLKLCWQETLHSKSVLRLYTSR